MIEDVVIAIRWVTVLLGLINFLWLVMWTSNSWSKLPSVSRASSMALIGFCFAVVYAVAESIALDAPIGFRSVIALFANLNLLYVLVKVAR